MSLRIMSLNMWGVPNVRHRLERFGELQEWLAKNPEELDIVCIQEIFVRHDVDRVVEGAWRGGLAYHHAFSAGPGFIHSDAPGLLVLSRFPIVDALFHRFSVNGKPHKIHHIDWWFGKGIGLVRVDTGCSTVDCFITHLVAAYVPWKACFPEDEYAAQRAVQAYECSRWMELTQRSDLTVLCCDMNAPRGTCAHGIIMSRTHMQDAHADDTYPTWAYDGNPYTTGEDPARIDYILWKGHGWKVSKSWSTLQDPVGRHYISDHCAVVAEFERVPVSTKGIAAPNCDEKLEMLVRAGIVYSFTQKQKHYALAIASVLLLCVHWCALLCVVAFVHLCLGGYFYCEEIAAFTQCLRELHTSARKCAPPRPSVSRSNATLERACRVLCWT